MNTPLRVLIVEDSEDDTLLLIRALRRGGYRDLTFHRVDTPEDMETALREKWDVVISDYSMPKFNGLNALRLIQAKKLDIPFIIVSGTIGEDIAVESMRAGAYDYLMKDNLMRLAPAVQRELQEAHSREARRNAEKEKNQLIARLQTQHNTLMELVAHPVIATDQRDQALQTILQAAANTLEVEHVKVWQFFNKGNSIKCIQEYPLPAKETTKEIINLSTYPQQITRIKSGKIIVIPDTYTNPKVPDWAQRHYKTQNIRAIIIVPIYLQGKVIGLVAYENLRDSRQWAPDEVTFANQVANLLAQSLLNANLHRRANELETITHISYEITAVRDLNVIFNFIASKAAELINASVSEVYALRADGCLYIEAGYGIEDDFITTINTQGIPVNNDTIIGQAINEHRPIQTLDKSNHIQIPDQHKDKTQGPRSILAVPMIKGKEVIGGIVLWQKEIRNYTPEEIAFIQALAQQCVNAIENARLLAAEAERRREAETLQAITQALSATLELPQVLELILSQLEKVVPYDSASVQQRTGEELELMGGRGFANIEELLGLTFDLTAKDNPNCQVVQTRAPVILDNAPELYEKFNTPPYSETKISSWLGVPLIFGNRIIGIITLDKKEPGFYKQKHARLAQAFAAQAAIAIENARIFAEEEHRATELARALEQQKELANLKNQFIQNVSHELRTPLAIARGYAEILYTGGLGELPPESQQAVEIITRRTRMLTRLIEDINAILEVETHQPEYQPVNMTELIMKHVPDFEAAAKKAGVDLITDVQSNTVLIYGNPTQLDRVLDNLLGNALKFTPQGGSIHVQLKQHNQKLLLEVQDTGIGIPEDKLDHIFERFYQVDGSASRRYGGTGLGLALVKEICEIHNGTVEVESTLGVGSTFKVILPIPPTSPTN